MKIRKQSTSRFLAIGASLTLLATVAQAQTNPLAKGPDPTNASIQAVGPFAISSQTVARGGGFGGGTVFSPNTPGQYAVVAFCPGFLSRRSSITALSQRLASHGFVVIAIDTNATTDLPPSRGTQLLAALNRTVALTTGPVAGKVDGNRRVVAGWSMGGGGTLFASETNSAIKAGTGFAPFSSDKSFNTAVPQLIIGAQNDGTAPVNSHSIPFFNQLPNATPKTYVEIAGAGHSFPTTSTPNQPASKLQIAWVKRFADNDTRYEQFITAEAIQAERDARRLSNSMREATPF